MIGRSCSSSPTSSPAAAARSPTSSRSRSPSPLRPPLLGDRPDRPDMSLRCPIAAPTSSAWSSRPWSASTWSTRCCAGRSSRWRRAGSRSPSSSSIVVALTQPLGAYMARVFRDERVFLTPVVGADRAPHLPGARGSIPSDEQDWKAYARSLIVFSLLSWLALYLILRTQGDPAVQPRRLPLGPVGRQLQHRLVVRHQHQLAVLRRRDDAQLLRPDGRADGAELRLRRGRHRVARGADPRHHRPQRREPRQLLAGPDPQPLLHPAAALDRRRPDPRLPGRAPDASGTLTAHDPRGRQPDPRARPGRLADRDQAARHQRRRLLQRQLGASVREPDAALQLRRDAARSS